MTVNDEEKSASIDDDAYSDDYSDDDFEVLQILLLFSQSACPRLSSNY